MNQKALESIVAFYKTNYVKIENNELYKWKAVKTFQDNWEKETVDAEEAGFSMAFICLLFNDVNPNEQIKFFNYL